MKKNISHKDLPRWVSEFFDSRISPKDMEVVRRLVERNDDMKGVYAEIEKKMTKLSPHVMEGMGSFTQPLLGVWPYTHGHGMLLAIIDGAKYYNEKAARDTREERRVLKDLRKGVIKSCEKLISQLARLEQIEEKGQMSLGASTNVFDLIERAGKKNFLFRSHIEPIIARTRTYDPGRYYPDFREVLGAMIEEFEESTPGPTTSLDAAVFNHQKTSPADFIRFLLEAFRQLKKISSRTEGYRLAYSKMFELSNKSLVDITRCALNLPDNSLSEDYITKVKQSLKTEDSR